VPPVFFQGLARRRRAGKTGANESHAFFADFRKVETDFRYTICGFVSLPKWGLVAYERYKSVPEIQRVQPNEQDVSPLAGSLRALMSERGRRG
jgi:hypothetical protein